MNDPIAKRLRDYSGLTTDGIPLYLEAADTIERLTEALNRCNEGRERDTATLRVMSDVGMLALKQIAELEAALKLASDDPFDHEGYKNTQLFGKE